MQISCRTEAYTPQGEPLQRITLLSDDGSYIELTNYGARWIAAWVPDAKGHLSNETAGKFIKNLLNDHIKTVILGHLSSENNFPELAFETVKNELKGNSFTDDVRDFDLHTAFRDRNDRLYEL